MVLQRAANFISNATQFSNMLKNGQTQLFFL